MHPHHFLLVTFPAQGQITPARHLARRLARSFHARVTISTSLFAHRRMFPSSAGELADENEDLISYFPYSDGFDDGFKPSTDDSDQYMPRFKQVGPQTLTLIARSLASRGRPVTCVIYTNLISWAADVARDLAVPSVLFWVQPATVFAICHRYFHGFADMVSAHKNDPSFSVELPGLPSFQIRDLPFFFFLNNPKGLYASIRDGFEEMFQTLDRDKPTVLVNTFDLLEPAAISAIDELKVIAIGPMVDPIDQEAASGGDLFAEDPKGYMEWLDSEEERSVVYVSFGSFQVISDRQMEEIKKGLEESERPYLWVVRRDSRKEGGGRGEDERVGEEKGMVVEWCNQVRVLSHRSIGCFVTHCGWNSTVESMVCGVPLVMLPQWTEQAMNARMAEREWGTGVRAEVDEEGVVKGGEIRRCLEHVMGVEGVEIRKRVDTWKDKAKEAVEEGGSSDRNLRAFVDDIGASSLQS